MSASSNEINSDTLNNKELLDNKQVTGVWEYFKFFRNNKTVESSEKKKEMLEDFFGNYKKAFILPISSISSTDSMPKFNSYGDPISLSDICSTLPGSKMPLSWQNCRIDYNYSGHTIVIKNYGISLRKKNNQNIFEIYDLNKYHGSGAFGAVYDVDTTVYSKQDGKYNYKQRGANLSKHIVVKVLKNEVINPAEAKIAKTVSDLGVRTNTETKSNIMVMNYIEGEDLHIYLFRTSPTISEKYKISIALLSAMKKVHDKDIIHFDVKPQNIRIAHNEGEFTAHLVDFGLSAFSGKGNTGVRGTMRYQPHSKEYTSPTKSIDIYALGKTLFEVWGNNNTPKAIKNIIKSMTGPREKRPNVDKLKSLFIQEQNKYLSTKSNAQKAVAKQVIKSSSSFFSKGVNHQNNGATDHHLMGQGIWGLC